MVILKQMMKVVMAENFTALGDTMLWIWV